MAIEAVQLDYKRAFEKHYHAYQNWDKAGSDISKYLILTYCVECGLKYMLMKEKRLQRANEAQPDIEADLRSHDFHKLLKRLRYAGCYTFPPIRTVHNDIVTPPTYHQLCRYFVRPTKDHQQYVQQYNGQLVDIAKWLKEQV